MSSFKYYLACRACLCNVWHTPGRHKSSRQYPRFTSQRRRQFSNSSFVMSSRQGWHSAPGTFKTDSSVGGKDKGESPDCGRLFKATTYWQVKVPLGKHAGRAAGVRCAWRWVYVCDMNGARDAWQALLRACWSGNHSLSSAAHTAVGQAPGCAGATHGHHGCGEKPKAAVGVAVDDNCYISMHDDISNNNNNNDNKNNRYCRESKGARSLHSSGIYVPVAVGSGRHVLYVNERT